MQLEIAYIYRERERARWKGRQKGSEKEETGKRENERRLGLTDRAGRDTLTRNGTLT